MHWILEGKKPKEVERLVWARWFENVNNRIVAVWESDDVKVTTVFFGINMGCDRVGRLLLFETMIFRGEHDGHQVRAATWEEAMHEHEEAIALVCSVVVG